MRPPATPDSAWTTDRLGRLLAGGSILLCLGGYWLASGWLRSVLMLAALTIGAQLVVTALLGRCPLHRAMKRLGIKDREEVFVEFRVPSSRY